MKKEITFEEKSKFVFELLLKKNKSSLASLCLMLMTKQDILRIFKEKDI